MADRSTITRIASALAALLALAGCSQEPEPDDHFDWMRVVDRAEYDSMLLSIPEGQHTSSGAVMERKPRGLRLLTSPGWDCTDAAKNGGECKRGTINPSPEGN